MGVSVLVTLAELLPECSAVLYKGELSSNQPFSVVRTLTVQRAANNDKEYIWDLPPQASDIQYISQHYAKLTKPSIYQLADNRHHIFIPMMQDDKVLYAIDVSSEHDIEHALEMIITVGKVCENFYAVLSASERDTLTGLLNRRTYESKLASLLTTQYQKQLANQKTEQSSIANIRQITNEAYTWLAVLDIDHFKQVNDNFGHIIGDEVLLTLSQLLEKEFRANDLLFRFGGEEFVIIFEPISFTQAEQALAKFMKAVRQYSFPLVGKLTVSIGYARITMSDHPKNILDNADKALYYAKEHGRDCVFNYEQLVEQGKIDLQQHEGDIELF